MKSLRALLLQFCFVFIGLTAIAQSGDSIVVQTLTFDTTWTRRGKFNLDFKGPKGEYRIEIYNLTGSLLKAEKINFHGYDNRDLDLSGYEKGIYMIRVSNENTNLIKRVIIN